MSGNIHDTNINIIKKEVYDLIHDLENNNDIIGKYNYLTSTSKTLYEYIIKNYNKQINESFINNLEMMLNGIEKIQKSRNTEKEQHDQSVLIGEKLASQYIPQLKK
jgi:hypothetical protein